MESERRSPGADEPAGGYLSYAGACRWMLQRLVLVALVGVAVMLAAAWLMFPCRIQGSRRQLTTRMHVAAIGECLESFRQREHRLPARLEELRTPGPGCLAEEYADLVDAWGNLFVYVVLAADRFDLRSAGPDGVLGGSGADDDIVWGAVPVGR